MVDFSVIYPITFSLTGTNEDAIVNILPYRNCTQRVEITIMFKTMFGKVSLLMSYIGPES